MLALAITADLNGYVEYEMDHFIVI